MTDDIDDGPLTIEDLVSGKVADSLGEGIIASRAILIVEVLNAESVSLRFVVSEQTPSHVALGMVRSTLLRLEDYDLAFWDEGKEDD